VVDGGNRRNDILYVTAVVWITSHQVAKGLIGDDSPNCVYCFYVILVYNLKYDL
jgi:hypothetical protein